MSPKLNKIEIETNAPMPAVHPGSVGVLLLNLGTPSAPTVSAVRRYLKEFLLDSRVVDIPTFARWLLVYGVILPFRPFQSAKAYQSIWTPAGSPLLVHSVELVKKLQQSLPNHFHVALGMRYGEPSISQAVTQLQSKLCDKIIVLPMFPQYSSAATGSALEEACRVLSQHNIISHLEIISDFYDHPDFIAAQAQLIQPFRQDYPDDHVIFSYHGLPERQVKNSHPHVVCDLSKPCPEVSQDRRFCYRAQCYATSRALANTLALDEAQYTVCFQSRLGRVPWIQPYLDETLPKLYQQGTRTLTVACPSFSADCLETIEEIGIRAKAQWLALGGEQLRLVPCLNAFDPWVESLKRWVVQYST